MTLSRLRTSVLLAAAFALTGAAAMAQSPAPAAPASPAPAAAPAAAPPAAGATTPPAAAPAGATDTAGLVASVCTSCHGMTVISAKGRSAADWSDVVDHMVDYGAMASPSDLAAIKAYLAKTYPAAP